MGASEVKGQGLQNVKQRVQFIKANKHVKSYYPLCLEPLLKHASLHWGYLKLDSGNPVRLPESFDCYPLKSFKMEEKNYKQKKSIASLKRATYKKDEKSML